MNKLSPQEEVFYHYNGTIAFKVLNYPKCNSKRFSSTINCYGSFKKNQNFIQQICECKDCEHLWDTNLL